MLQWSRVSDHIGRKPVLLIGLFGTMLSMLSFGLSRSLSALMVRCVIVTAISRTTHIIYHIQSVFDWTAKWQYWYERPYIHSRFRLCRTFFRNRTVILQRGTHLHYGIITMPDLFQTLPKRQKYQKGAIHDEEKPLPLRKLLVYPVILSISNYIVLAFLFTALSALFPLFLAMPLEIGGLDLDPAKIGYITGLTGLAGAIFLPLVNMAAVILGKQSPAVSSIIFVVLACRAFSYLAFSKF